MPDRGPGGLAPRKPPTAIDSQIDCAWMLSGCHCCDLGGRAGCWMPCHLSGLMAPMRGAMLPLGSTALAGQAVDGILAWSRLKLSAEWINSSGQKGTLRSQRAGDDPSPFTSRPLHHMPADTVRGRSTAGNSLRRPDASSCCACSGHTGNGGSSLSLSHSLSSGSRSSNSSSHCCCYGGSSSSGSSSRRTAFGASHCGGGAWLMTALLVALIASAATAAPVPLPSPAPAADAWQQYVSSSQAAPPSPPGASAGLAPICQCAVLAYTSPRCQAAARSHCAKRGGGAQDAFCSSVLAVNAEGALPGLAQDSVQAGKVAGYLQQECFPKDTLQGDASYCRCFKARGGLGKGGAPYPACCRAAGQCSTQRPSFAHTAHTSPDPHPCAGTALKGVCTGAPAAVQQKAGGGRVLVADAGPRQHGLQAAWRLFDAREAAVRGNNRRNWRQDIERRRQRRPTRATK